MNYTTATRETSIEARPVPSVAERGRDQVFNAIDSSPIGLTDEQIAIKLDMNPNTARPRRNELAKSGHIVVNGRRATKSGSSACVWVVKTQS